MPGPWRPVFHDLAVWQWVRFNLRRDARPLATQIGARRQASHGKFQSQTRCQAPGDQELALYPLKHIEGFNLRRDARPLATGLLFCFGLKEFFVSISDEMPGPWRLGVDRASRALVAGFNLRRDARPLATSQIVAMLTAIPAFQSQ